MLKEHKRVDVEGKIRLYTQRCISEQEVKEYVESEKLKLKYDVV